MVWDDAPMFFGFDRFCRDGVYRLVPGKRIILVFIIAQASMMRIGFGAGFATAYQLQQLREAFVRFAESHNLLK